MSYISLTSATYRPSDTELCVEVRLSDTARIHITPFNMTQYVPRDTKLRLHVCPSHTEYIRFSTFGNFELFVSILILISQIKTQSINLTQVLDLFDLINY